MPTADEARAIREGLASYLRGHAEALASAKTGENAIPEEAALVADGFDDRLVYQSVLALVRFHESRNPTDAERAAWKDIVTKLAEGADVRVSTFRLRTDIVKGALVEHVAQAGVAAG